MAAFTLQVDISIDIDAKNKTEAKKKLAAFNKFLKAQAFEGSRIETFSPQVFKEEN